MRQVPVIRRAAGAIALCAGVAACGGAAALAAPVAALETPVARILDTRVVEGNSGTRHLVFVVKLDAQSATPASFKYVTVPGTAGPHDYSGRTGILTIPPHTSSGRIEVPVYGDKLRELNETVKLQLSQPAGAVLGRARATGLIIDDDR